MAVRTTAAACRTCPAAAPMARAATPAAPPPTASSTGSMAIRWCRRGRSSPRYRAAGPIAIRGSRPMACGCTSGATPARRGLSDIYLATRTTTAQNCGSANAVVNLDRSDSDESRAALSGDEKTLVMSSNRPPPVAPPPAPKFDIYITTRNDVTKDFGTPSPNDPRVTALNADAGNPLDPFLTADGLKLYLAPNTAGGNRQEIRLATRATPADNFGGSAPVTELNVLTSSADPALSLDERIVVFTGRTGNQTTELYYATRATATGSFGTPVKIPTVNSNDNDADPLLSADGCELYFASDRDGGGKYHLFHATVTK